MRFMMIVIPGMRRNPRVADSSTSRIFFCWTSRTRCGWLAWPYSRSNQR